jgi:glycosyltransferase involved in cell wall biosynthesis
VYSCIPGNFRGGISKIVFELSAAQVALGHHVQIVTTDRNSYQSAKVPSNATVSGVDIAYFPVTWSSWMRSPKMRKALLGADTHAIHSHNTFLAPNCYASEAARHLSVPVFYHTHGALDPVLFRKGTIQGCKKQLYLKLVEKLNYAQAAMLFANSVSEVEQIRHWGIGQPVTILPNGIDCNRLSMGDKNSWRIANGISPDAIVLLFVGRIVPKKGLHLLLEALPSIQTGPAPVHVLIAGDPNQDVSYISTLKRIVDSCGMEKSVHWLGFLDEASKPNVYASSDIFCHPSESEGMAMSVLEACGAGIPTIVTNSCNMSDAAIAGAVMQCSYDVFSLTQCIRSLVESAERRKVLSDTALKHMQSHHSWASIAQTTIDCYTTAIRHS